jgi:hypothetical protein
LGAGFGAFGFGVAAGAASSPVVVAGFFGLAAGAGGIPPSSAVSTGFFGLPGMVVGGSSLISAGLPGGGAYFVSVTCCPGVNALAGGVASGL